MLRLAPISSFALAAALAVALPATLQPHASSAAVEVAVAVTVPPPALPVYAQPIIPGPGYVWTPGYWAWGPMGYYWVPGTWIVPPAVGLLWTPGYWGWVDGRYFWHAGYWGPVVGFYGGINYGFGYFGVGYVGGHWDHDRFFYNRAVNNFGHVHITNVFNEPVHNVGGTRVSFNGGRGGTSARPNAEQEAAARGQHVDPTGAQTRHEHAAAQNRAFLASVNHGAPSVGATAHAASFSGAGVVHTRNAATTSRGAPGGQQAQRQHVQGRAAPNTAAHNAQHQAPVRQMAAPHASGPPRGGNRQQPQQQGAAPFPGGEPHGGGGGHGGGGHHP